MREALAYAAAHRSRFVAELLHLLRIPSISAEPQHAGDVARCAQWLADHLQSIGLSHVRVVPLPRHPLVYGAWRGAPGKPTLLIYGHYDVQPVDPVAAWRTPPFDPQVRNQSIFGRGASDDKGQLFAHIKALESCLRTTGKLPVNVICLFEGEEEIGSPSLHAWLAQHKTQLRADAAVISDTRFLAPGRPAITYALRGGVGAELHVQALRGDVHSGSFGGAVPNPIQVLCEIVAGLHDAEGRIAVPGLYDQVRTWHPAERRRMAAAGPGDETILRDAGAGYPWGERGFSAYERVTIRPALTLNGITGGYQGAGGKAIIPAAASARLSLRLVPDQDPDMVARLLQQRIAALTPPTVQSRLTITQKSRPALLDRRHYAMRAAAAAYCRGFGADASFLRSGGSIPVVNTFQSVLGIPAVLMGFALPGDRMHAPNERFALSQFHRAIDTCIHFLDLLPQEHQRHDH